MRKPGQERQEWKDIEKGRRMLDKFNLIFNYGYMLNYKLIQINLNQ